MTPVRAIASVRHELKVEISEVRGELGEVRGDVRELSGEVRDLTGAVGTMSGQLAVLPRLVDALAAERDAQRKDDHVVVTTQLDVMKHRAITEIDDTAKANQAKRELFSAVTLKVIAIVATVVAGIMTLIAAGVRP